MPEDWRKEEVCLCTDVRTILRWEGYKKRAYSSDMAEEGKAYVSSLHHFRFHAEEDAFVEEDGEGVEVYWYFDGYGKFSG